MALLSVIVLTYNEADNLPTCLSSLKELDAEVFIVDSGSTDNTLKIAEQFNCYIYHHGWINYAEQLNWALQNLPIMTPWVMRLDADERLMPDLVRELQQCLPHTPEAISGYQLKRRVFFMGRWIKYGGYYPTWLLRVWRTGRGYCEQRWMDEHIILTQGSVAKLDHDIIDENQKGLSFFTDKHNRYADREVKDMLGLMLAPADALLSNQTSQASQRRWIKKNLYTQFPLFVRPFIYFLLRYIVGLGFLDGLEGLIFHVLQGFWYRFLVDAKIYEMRRTQERIGTTNQSILGHAEQLQSYPRNNL